MAEPPKRSRLLHRFFSTAKYDSLLATWPSTAIETRLVEESPPSAQTILKLGLYEQVEEQVTPGPDTWGLWLHLFRAEGGSDAVQVALSGLLFVQHELRHHIDIYSTTLGSTQVVQLYGEYQQLQGLLESEAGSTEARRWITRLRSSQAKRRHLLGLVADFDPQVWEEQPAYEHAFLAGTVRQRRSRTDPTDAIITLSLPDGSERALSLSALLEMRAFIETAGHLHVVLHAAGATLEERQEAVALLAGTGIDTTRDDYWGVLSALSSQTTARRMAEQFAEFADRGYAAGWFALHVDAPGTRQDVVLEDHPEFRFIAALGLFKRMRTPQGEPVQHWIEQVFEIMQQEVRGRPLGSLLHDHLAAMQHVGAGGTVRLRSMPEAPPLRGVARGHVSYLAAVAAESLQQRLSLGAKWRDDVGWPDDFDPRTIVVGIQKCPQDVREAVDTLNAVRNVLDWSLPDEQVERAMRAKAKTLFDSR